MKDTTAATLVLIVCSLDSALAIYFGIWPLAIPLLAMGVWFNVELRR